MPPGVITSTTSSEWAGCALGQDVAHVADVGALAAAAGGHRRRAGSAGPDSSPPPGAQQIASSRSVMAVTWNACMPGHVDRARAVPANGPARSPRPVPDLAAHRDVGLAADDHQAGLALAGGLRHASGPAAAASSSKPT